MLGFLGDTGAHISVCKESSLQEGLRYDTSSRVKIKGISTALLQTLGTVELHLETKDMYTRHTFQVVSDCISIPCDVTLGRDFWESNGVKINSETRMIEMGRLKVNFDERLEKSVGNLQMYIMLTPWSVTIIEVPTVHEENVTGITAKEKLVPGVYMSESLTKSMNGCCVVIVANTLDTKVTVQTPEM